MDPVCLSWTTSTGSSELHPAHPDYPNPSVGIVTARLMELKLEKGRWRSRGGLPVISMLRVSQELLGMAPPSGIPWP